MSSNKISMSLTQKTLLFPVSDFCYLICLIDSIHVWERDSLQVKFLSGPSSSKLVTVNWKFHVFPTDICLRCVGP